MSDDTHEAGNRPQSGRGDTQRAEQPRSNGAETLRHVSTAFHAVGVLLSGVVFVTDGLGPGLGFPIAVGALSVLGMLGTPPANAPTEVLRVIRGDVLGGGMKQGVLIKSLFGAALVYRGIAVRGLGTGGFDRTSLLLGGALFSTAIGTAFAAYAVTNRIRARERDGTRSMPETESANHGKSTRSG